MSSDVIHYAERAGPIDDCAVVPVNQKEMAKMALLDLQGLETPTGGGGGGGGGSTLTILGCGSHRPSNLSLLICH